MARMGDELCEVQGDAEIIFVGDRPFGVVLEGEGHLLANPVKLSGFLRMDITGQTVEVQGEVELSTSTGGHVTWVGKGSGSAAYLPAAEVAAAGFVEKASPALEHLTESPVLVEYFGEDDLSFRLVARSWIP